MRKGEVEGVDYIFVSKLQFERWIQEDKLLEHALVYGEYKGILRSQVHTALENNQDVLLRLDIQGAATMRKLMPNVISIFVVCTKLGIRASLSSLRIKLHLQSMKNRSRSTCCSAFIHIHVTDVVTPGGSRR